MNPEHQQDGAQLKRIAWDPAFETGHPGIDTEHRRLVKLLDRLVEATSNHASDDKLLAILIELQRYTIYHFTHEAELMEEFAISEAHGNAHRMAHSVFVSRVNEAIREVQQGSTSVSHELLKYLGQWLLTHIMGMDRDLVEEIRQSRRSISRKP